MKFQSTTKDADPAIEIRFERSLSNGWSITRESESKVVYFVIINTLHTQITQYTSNRQDFF